MQPSRCCPHLQVNLFSLQTSGLYGTESAWGLKLNLGKKQSIVCISGVLKSCGQFFKCGLSSMWSSNPKPNPIGDLWREGRGGECPPIQTNMTRNQTVLMTRSCVCAAERPIFLLPIYLFIFKSWNLCLAPTQTHWPSAAPRQILPMSLGIKNIHKDIYPIDTTFADVHIHATRTQLSTIGELTPHP